jgi:hypothetical protein
MIEIIVLSVFFAGLVIGGLVTNAMGRLPTAEELQAEDRARIAQFSKERGTT